MKSLAPFLSVISICSLSIILLGTPITGLGTGYYGWDILQQPDTNSPRKPAFAPLPVEVPESRDDAYNLILSWSKTLANEDDPAGGTKPLPVRERDRFSGLMNHLAITGSTLNAVPSSPESCYQVYRCLYKSLPDRPSSLPNPSLRNDTAAGAASIFGTCTSESANSLFQQDSFECPLKLNLKSSSSNSRIGGNCGLNGPGSDMDKWVGYNVSRNIGVFQNGGVDSEGVWWPGMSTLNDTSFSQALRSELLRQTGPPCSLESVCGGPLTCDDVGTFRGTGVGTPIQTSTWGFMTLTAMFNINMQLKNHYDEMKSALELLGLKAFLIGDFYPKPDKSFGLLDALTGLGTAFSIFGGFIPGAGAALGAAGAIAGGAGSFLSSSIAQSDRSDPLVAQKNFADEVSKIYNQLLSGLDDAAARLFKGEGIGIEGHTFNITDMMRDGAWVGPNVLTNVSELNQKLQIEIMSRSINALWKEFSSNKMWVTFVNLGDGPDLAKCMADTTGPQPFKYCADGGVYYTYNFLEEGVGGGGVGYPWGAQKLQEKFNISMNWVTEASAKSFRLAMKIDRVKPFTLDGIAGTATFLNESFTGDPGQQPLEDQAGRYPGSWTIPVCDISTWGSAWNWDYTAPTFPKNAEYTHPPCICGSDPVGYDTWNWAYAAGMKDFHTFWDRCDIALQMDAFQWPDGLTNISYPDADDKPHTISKKT